MTPCLLLIDPPQVGAWNMAVDEALLADADERGAAAVRFYRWSEPTLSLGYFQAAADRQLHPPSRDLPMVRRQSGGGALVHDRELTYSIALPATHPFARRPPSLYRLVHDALRDALAAQGVTVRTVGCCAESCGEPQSGGDAGTVEPFLCFERRHPIDLVVASAGDAAASSKVVGSAQRRRRGALLQHGSVLLERSPAAPELPGLAEARGRAIDHEEIVRNVAATVLAALELVVQRSALSDPLRQTAARLQASKYESAQWQQRR
ncbi:MAG: hypothetical protein KDA44_03150 [Planctomycetales bacterium]|nr:hypothetical protein [Planctomycetales bacterium]